MISNIEHIKNIFDLILSREDAARGIYVECYRPNENHSYTKIRISTTDFTKKDYNIYKYYDVYLFTKPKRTKIELRITSVFTGGNEPEVDDKTIEIYNKPRHTDAEDMSLFSDCALNQCRERNLFFGYGDKP